MTTAQQKQLNALSGEFVSMKQLRKERKGANLNVLRKLMDAGLVECQDPNKGNNRFVCDELEFRTA